MARYSVGASMVLAGSIGVILIIYGLGLSLSPLNILALLLGSLGAYTLAYAICSKRDVLYYSIWGVVLLGAALASALYTVVNPLLTIGSLILLMILIVLTVYWRRKG